MNWTAAMDPHAAPSSIGAVEPSLMGAALGNATLRMALSHCGRRASAVAAKTTPWPSAGTISMARLENAGR